MRSAAGEARDRVRATLARPGAGGLSVPSLHQEFRALALAERGCCPDPEQVAGPLHRPTVRAAQDTTLNVASDARLMERAGDRIAVSTSLGEHVLFGRLTCPDRAPRVMIGSSRPAPSPPDARDVDDGVAVLREAGLLDAVAGP